MANTLAVLNGYLTSALKAPSLATWPSAEKDQLIIRAVADLYPAVSYALAPQSYTQALTSGTYFYAINPIIVKLVRVDWLDSAGVEMGALADNLWEITGDMEAGTAKIHITPFISETTGTLRYNGYGRYNTSSVYIPEDYVNAVIAECMVEALEWGIADRGRYKQWQGQAQKQNVSVTEYATLLSEARQRRDVLRRRAFTFRKPVPGRIG